MTASSIHSHGKFSRYGREGWGYSDRGFIFAHFLSYRVSPKKYTKLIKRNFKLITSINNM